MTFPDLLCASQPPEGATLQIGASVTCFGSSATYIVQENQEALEVWETLALCPFPITYTAVHQHDQLWNV